MFAHSQGQAGRPPGGQRRDWQVRQVGWVAAAALQRGAASASDSALHGADDNRSLQASAVVLRAPSQVAQWKAVRAPLPLRCRRGKCLAA